MDVHVFRRIEEMLYIFFLLKLRIKKFFNAFQSIYNRCTGNNVKLASLIDSAIIVIVYLDES